MRKKLNKNVEVWRGTKTPPTTYHVWVKPDGSIHVHDGTNWKSTEYGVGLQVVDHIISIK